MTLAQQMGITLSHNTSCKEDFVLKEAICSTCEEVLWASVVPVGQNFDLIWPHRVICNGTLGHELVPRTPLEDANTTVRGKELTKSGATSYLKEYV